MLPDSYKDLFGPLNAIDVDKKKQENKARYKRLTNLDLEIELRAAIDNLDKTMKLLKTNEEKYDEVERATEQILKENEVGLSMIQTMEERSLEGERMRSAINADSMLPKAIELLSNINEDLLWMYKTLLDSYREADILKKKIEAKNIVDLM